MLFSILPLKLKLFCRISAIIFSTERKKNENRIDNHGLYLSAYCLPDF